METQLVHYDHFEAFVAHIPSHEKKPAILIFPAWDGRSSFVEEKAKELAEMGYVGIALDVYGNGKVGKTTEEKLSLMTPLMEDRALLKKRILLAYKMAKDLSMVDQTKMAAIGFCFGGLCALDLARAGAKLKGVVSFHGLLTAPPFTRENVHAKLLVLHGYDDPMVPPKEILTFAEEMKGLDFQIHAYGGVKHAFTNPDANDPNMGTIYHPLAEKRSFDAMKSFFKELFGN